MRTISTIAGTLVEKFDHRRGLKFSTAGGAGTRAAASSRPTAAATTTAAEHGESYEGELDPAAVPAALGAVV